MPAAVAAARARSRERLAMARRSALAARAKPGSRRSLILDTPSMPQAGGTWFGVNERGVLVAVTNRLKSQPPPQPRSRGLLARDLLACPSAAVAADLAARELGQNRYAGCNLLCADADRALLLHGGD